MQARGLGTCWCICSDVVQARGCCVQVGVSVAMLYKQRGLCTRVGVSVAMLYKNIFQVRFVTS